MAVAAYEKALQLDPTEVMAYISLGNEYQQSTGGPQETVDLYTTATQANPQQASLFLTLGDQLQRQGAIQAAITTYQLALELTDAGSDALPTRGSRQSTDRVRSQAYARLASIFEDQGQLEAATSFYLASAAAGLTEPRSQVLLGDFLRRRNDLAGAEAVDRRVINADPS